MQISFLLIENTADSNIFASTEGSANQAAFVLNRHDIKVIRWAPHAIAFWSIDNNDYIKIVFPLDILPVPGGDSHQVVSTLSEVNFTMPKAFAFKGDMACFSTPKVSYHTLKVPHPSKYLDNLKIKHNGLDYNLMDYWYTLGSSVIPMIARTRYNTKPEDVYNFTAENISLDLFRQELIKVLTNPVGDPSKFFRFLKDVGALNYLMPELAENIGCRQNESWHSEDVFDHLMRTVDKSVTYTTDPMVRLAALLHDVGKAATRKEVPNSNG